MSRRAPEDLRRLALCWCYEHLDDGLAAHRLAALWLEHRVAAGATRGDVPDALLTHLDESEAQRALEELKRDGLLYARRLDGFQLTGEGLVLGRCMVQATAAASAAAQEPEVVATAKVPAAILERYTPAELQAILEENLDRELKHRLGQPGAPLCPEDLLRGTGTGTPLGLTNDTHPRSTT